MKREELSDVIGGIDETLILEASRYDSTLSDGSSERIVHMKKKRIIVFALAAALILALGAGAYAAGIFGGKVEITTTPVDHDDPAWEQVLEDAPYVNEWQYARWAPHNNLPTAEIEALLAEMEGKKEYSDRSFGSVSEMEKTYGIELLKLGNDERNVQSWLRFWDENDHSAGSNLLGSWNSYEDGVYLFTDYSYYFNSPYLSSSSGFGWTEIESNGEYEIKSLGVTASLVSGLIESDARNARYICAAFAYGGIDYEITAILDPAYTAEEMLGKVTTDWLCEKLETLQKPSWVSETAGPVPEMPSDDEPNDSVPSGDSIMNITWAAHDNLPTEEIEALLSEMDETEDASTRGYESVSEMEKAYGIELLKSDSGKDYAEAALWVEETPIVYDYNDPIPTTNGVHLFGGWVSSVDGIRIYNYYSCCFNNPSFRQVHGYPLTGIDSVGEYDIRSLGVTASLISGWVDRDGQTERRFVAYFSYEGIDYLIDARPTGEQDITMEWLCALLETLHK